MGLFNMQKIIVAVFVSCIIVLCGCEQRTNRRSPKNTSSRTAKSKAKRSNVGVGNVVDYATGETPMRIRNRKKNQIKAIEQNYKNRYKD